MPYAFKFVIPQTGFETVVSMDVQNRCYILEDGTRIRMHKFIGWCPDCKTFRTVERLPDLKTIQSEIALAKSASLDEDVSALDRNRYLKILKHHKLVHRWRQLRTGMRRCLECGGTSISTAQRLNDEQMLFPPGKAVFNIEDKYLAVEASVHSQFKARKSDEVILYDIEGNRVSDSAKN